MKNSLQAPPNPVPYPVPSNFIPYAHQSLDAADIEAMCEILRSDWLTTGPSVRKFEQTIAAFTGETPHAVAVSSGTAGLHAAMFALGIKPGDEVIVPPMTFAATANCVLYQGGTPVFADVDPDTLLIDPGEVEKKITSKTQAIIGVDYAGQPCDWDALREIAGRRGLATVADSCHALGAEYKGRKTGTLADMTVFSFHPVKHITTGEGGMVLTHDAKLAERLRLFRNHGIASDGRQREEQGVWSYEMTELGFNYRITDFQSALGISQMAKLPGFLKRRRGIAALYDRVFFGTADIRPLHVRADVFHGYHLYVVRVPAETRTAIFSKLRQNGIGTNVHYIPVHLHPYYRKRLDTGFGLCPVAEDSCREILSIPMHACMSDADVDHVISRLQIAVKEAGG
jgi:UDP-4-amino-4,6-dideoxy-N-acetyl-beta-L-altrosamine transaminase